MVVEQFDHVGHVVLAADQSMGQLDQRNGPDGSAQRWELVGETRCSQLEDLRRLHDVAEAMTSQRVDRRRPAQLVVQCLHRGRRQQDLTAVTDRVQPRAEVQRPAERLAVAQHDVAHVDRHPDGHPADGRPIAVADLTLGRDRSGERIRWFLERSDHAVAGEVEGGSRVFGDDAAQQVVVPFEHGDHRFGELLPPTRAGLDVGEQECQSASIRRRPHGLKVVRGRRSRRPGESLPYP